MTLLQKIPLMIHISSSTLKTRINESRKIAKVFFFFFEFELITQKIMIKKQLLWNKPSITICRG